MNRLPELFQSWSVYRDEEEGIVEDNNEPPYEGNVFLAWLARFFIRKS
jgi:hypothetical protein